MRSTRAIPLVLGCLVAAAGCSRDPVESAHAFARQGDAYLARNRTAEATIAYRKSVAANPRDGQVRLKLAQLFSDAGDVQGAYREYIAAADLLPRDLNAQLAACRMLLSVGRFDDARGRADKALALEPGNVEAMVLKGSAFAGLKDFDAAMRETEAAIRSDPSATKAYANLGTLQYAKGNLAAAEATLKRAVAADQRSAPALLALANFYWSTSRRDAAEGLLVKTTEIDPENLLANRALALLYLTSGREAEAERPLTAYAEAAPGIDGRLALAEYYAANKRGGEARELLQRVAGESDGEIPAKLRLASLAAASGDRPDAYRLLAEVLKKNPKQVDALVDQARLQLTDGRKDEALATARSAVAADPSSWQAQFALGSIQNARQQPGEAEKAFQEAVRRNPRFAAGYMELARLAIGAGKAAEAVQLARTAMEIAPADGNALLLLARALIRAGDLAGAEDILKKLRESSPHLSAVHAELGRMYAAKGDRPAARDSYQKAIQEDPASLQALQGLTLLDLQQHDARTAKARVEAASARAPGDAAVKLITARTYVSAGDLAAAEREFKRVVELDPGRLEGYDGLARVYAMQRRLPEAVAEFDRLARRQPRAAAPRVLAGVLLQAQNRPDEAKARFQSALEIDPRTPVAANNLAWLYADAGQNLDTALQLAQVAKAQLPDSHEVDDTLGWVYYKKGLASLAVASFEQSTASQPENPVYAYHLGLAHARNGDKAAARLALERALKLKPDFDGADDARKVLGSLKG